MCVNSLVSRGDMHLRRLRGFDEFPNGEHRCTRGKESIDKAIMDLGIEVGAAVFDDSETEIGVGSFKQCGEDDTTGGDSIEN